MHREEAAGHTKQSLATNNHLVVRDCQRTSSTRNLSHRAFIQETIKSDGFR